MVVTSLGRSAPAASAALSMVVMQGRHASNVGEGRGEPGKWGRLTPSGAAHRLGAMMRALGPLRPGRCREPACSAAADTTASSADGSHPGHRLHPRRGAPVRRVSRHLDGERPLSMHSQRIRGLRRGARGRLCRPPLRLWPTTARSAARPTAGRSASFGLPASRSASRCACSVPVTGGFRIVVTTVGEPPDDDGYQLVGGGHAAARDRSVNAEESYDGTRRRARTWSPSRTWRTSATWWAATLSRIPWCRGRRCRGDRRAWR